MQGVNKKNPPIFSLFSCQGKNTNYFIFFSIIWAKNTKNLEKSSFSA
tara:strand:- start:4786 stop:4926 length:141 start_codon:yes stop_codon:yes gene_type:complete